MRYVKRTEINTEKWDACVAKSDKPLIYGVSWYLDAATNSQWDGLIWGDYETVLPLPWNRKLIAKQFYRPMLLQQQGPFGNGQPKQTILPLLSKKSVQHQVALCEALIEGEQKRINLILNCNQEKQKLYEGFSKNRRYDARNIEHTVEELTVDEFMKFFKKFAAELIEDQGIHLTTIKQIIIACISNHHGLLLGGKVGDSVESVIFLSKYRGRHTLLLSATSKTGYEKSVNVFLLIYYIFKQAGKSIMLDFEGSEIPGVRDFYKSFGAQEEIYYLYTKQNQWIQRLKNMLGKS